MIILEKKLFLKFLRKNLKIRYFNCDKSGHLKKDYRQDFLINNDFSRDNPNRGPSFLEYAKGSIRLINTDQ